MNPYFEIHWAGSHTRTISRAELRRLMLDYRLRAVFAFGLFAGWELISPKGKYIHAMLWRH